MFGKRRNKSPDMSGCPRCGKPLMVQSGIVRCADCGTLNSSLWGSRQDVAQSVAQKPGTQEYSSGRKRRAVRHEQDEANLGQIGDRPGRIDRELDK